MNMVHVRVVSFFVSVPQLNGHKRAMNAPNTNSYHSIFFLFKWQRAELVNRENCELEFGKQTNGKHTEDRWGRIFKNLAEYET
jgi:hypothetical protein